MREQVFDWLKEQWTAQLLQTLQSKTEQQPVAAWDPESEHVAADGSLVWEQSVSEWPEPVIWIVSPAPIWQDLGGRTLRAAGVDSVEAADAKNAWIEILNKSLSGLAKELGRRMQREVLCESGLERAGTPPETRFFALRIRYDDGELPPLLIAFSAVLVEALDGIEGHPKDGIGDGSIQDYAVPVEQLGLQPAGISKTFDLLLEVGLPVSISFGRTQLAIRDVLKLTTGSIVELNRTVMEPVEVVVNDCVIARGEVVVVEGNYGVRIRQIISRQERLRTGTGSTQRAQKGATALDRAAF